jgi:hypothetical protein
MELWEILLTVANVALLVVGVLDYLYGEAEDSIAYLVFAIGLSAYLTLPIPKLPKLLMVGMAIGMASAIAIIYYKTRGIGLLDTIIGFYAPMVATFITLPTLMFGMAAAIAAIYLHAIRARGKVCSKNLPLPGTRVGVKAWLAWKDWYFVPDGVDVESNDWVEEKKKWKNMKKCIGVRFAIPLVWVYSLFHVTVTLSYFIIFGAI